MAGKTAEVAPVRKKERKWTIAAIRHDFKMNWQIYLLSIPIIAYFIVFNYIPMVGLVMAFQKYDMKVGFLGAGVQWVGFAHFQEFITGPFFPRLVRNTFLISIYSLVFSFPMPIIFALLLNEVKNQIFKKTIQTISYLPHFISMVVICGLIKDFCESGGMISTLAQTLGAYGGQATNLLQKKELFRVLYIGSDIWQGIGFGSIIYLAALSSIDQELYEAAVIDGAGRWKQTWHITLPGIAPTIIIMLIMRMGSLFSVGFEKIILLYNDLTMEVADVISSYVYRVSLLQSSRYDFGAAVGLFNSVINFALLLVTNTISRKVSETSLF